MEISGIHREELREAKNLLENPSLAAKMTDLIGSPIERGLALLPEKWSEHLNGAVRLSLERGLEVAIRSLREPRTLRTSRRFHKIAVVATGAGGGALGLPGLLVELPLSTTLMLRSIADIARSEGEDLSDVRSRLSCLEVFALGGRSQADDAADTGYFAMRSALAGTVSEAARYIAEKGVADKGAPALVRFISTIGSRFGVVVSEKVAAMAVPAIGAAGGAIVNSLFIDHFQDTARGHFTVRRLERRYSREAVESAYRELRP